MEVKAIMRLRKADLITAAIRKLESDKEGLRESFESTHQGILNAPKPTESRSDQTRFQLTQVANQIDRLFARKDEEVQALKSLQDNLTDKDFASKLSEKVLVGSLVEVQDESGSEEWYLILPGGGGIEISDDGRDVTLVTYTAPVAAALMNRTIGDEAIF